MQTYKIVETYGLNLAKDVIDFDLKKKKSFGPGQTYTAFSRVKTSIGELLYRGTSKILIKVNEDASLNMNCLNKMICFSL